MFFDPLNLSIQDRIEDGEQHSLLLAAVKRGGEMSRPRERRETGEQDLFRARLDQILNMQHELVRLAQEINWPLLEERFGEVYSDGPGMPPLPTRLMAGLAILKYTFDLADEVLCDRWVENRSAGNRGSIHDFLFRLISNICAARSSSATSCRSNGPR